MEMSLVFLLAFSLLWKLSQAVRCYSCTPDDPHRRQSCMFFNSSNEEFIKDCPESTLCLKRVVSFNVPNGVKVEGLTERLCAPQVDRGESVLVNGHWKDINVIYEKGYSESCNDVPAMGRYTKTILCACRGELCNHSDRLGAYSLVKFGLILLILYLV